MADTQRSGRCGGNSVRVQLPPSAPNFNFIDNKTLGSFHPGTHSGTQNYGIILIRQRPLHNRARDLIDFEDLEIHRFLKLAHKQQSS